MADFFVYAGVSIPGDKARDLSVEIDRLRRNHRYLPEDPLKFNTRERPNHVTPDSHRELKQEVVEAAAGAGVKLFSSFILHSVSTSPQDARQKEINRICYHFDCYLRRLDEDGIVLIDSFQDKGLIALLKEKFSVGIKGFPYSAAYRLDRILGVHLASIGTSHFCSLIDIVVGSLRYAVNTRNDQSSQAAGQILIQQLAPLCIVDGLGRAEEICFFFSPKSIKVSKYLSEYKALRDYFASAGIVTAQVPTAG